MQRNRLAWAAGLLSLVPFVALGEAQSEVIYSLRAWEVRAVTFDDGTASCVAQVSDGSDSFSVWGNGDKSIRLQFYSDAWDFGEGDTADLEVEIDRRGEWSLTNAELYLQSVLFDIPDSDDGVSFLTEVMQGNSLYLRNADGEDVVSYSLSGSSASIRALVDCMDQLGRSSNPFN